MSTWSQRRPPSRWPSLRAALGDLELRNRRYPQAIEQLTAASDLCRGASPELDSVAGFLLTLVPGETGDERGLCGWIESSLREALLRGAFADLAAAARGGSPANRFRGLAERALGLPLEDSERAIALYIRGTAALAAGAGETARRDLSAALAGALPADLAPLARNNLGMALLRLDRIDPARAELEKARAAGVTAAHLNLGILENEHGGEPQDALRHYREYLRAGGPRRREVAGWIERIDPEACDRGDRDLVQGRAVCKESSWSKTTR